MIKGTYGKHTSNSIFSGEKLNATPLQLEKGKDVCFHHFCSILYGRSALATAVKQEKEIKGTQIAMEEVKQPFFTEEDSCHLISRL